MISYTGTANNAGATLGTAETSDGVSQLVSGVEGHCLSVIIPLKTKASERIQNHNLVRHAADKARELLDGVTDQPEEVSLIRKRLEGALAALDLNHAKPGLGLFISQASSHRVDFPFPVPERIMLGDSFETRDVVYMAQAQRAYYVLSLTAERMRLFLASGGSMSEIQDEFFPCRYTDTHEYSRPARVRSYSGVMKNFERDKGTIEAIRLTAFLKTVDKRLQRYLVPAESEIVLAGQSRMITVMETLPNVSRHVAAIVRGTYASTEGLSLAAWNAIQAHRENVERALIARVNEAEPALKVSGIEDVREASSCGQGLLLLVERNYRYPFGEAPAGSAEKGGRIVVDLVDDVIETVLLKGGRVVFVDDDKLIASGRIVLLLRYQ